MRSRDFLIPLFTCLALLLIAPASVSAQEASTAEYEASADVKALTATPGVARRAEVGTIMIGVGGAFNSHVEDPGFGAGVSYQITPVFSVFGQFLYWLASEEEGDPGDISIVTVDVMGAYPLLQADSGLVVSAIAGLNFLRWSQSFEGFEDSGSDVGFNGGAMVLYPVGNLSIFVQGFAVGLGGDSDGFQFGGGVAFAI